MYSKVIPKTLIGCASIFFFTLLLSFTSEPNAAQKTANYSNDSALRNTFLIANHIAQPITFNIVESQQKYTLEAGKEKKFYFDQNSISVYFNENGPRYTLARPAAYVFYSTIDNKNSLVSKTRLMMVEESKVSDRKKSTK